jgi:uncharacterized membrane protein (UPF0127 family)
MTARAGLAAVLAAVLGGILVATSCAGCSDGKFQEKVAPMTHTTLKVAGRDVLVELQLDDAARQRGLMFRTELADEAGMLFVFCTEAMQHFYMRNTLIPLDIVFLEANGTVINVTHGQPGVELPTCDSTRPALMVLELAGGWSERHGLKPGDVVVVPPEILSLAH